MSCEQADLAKRSLVEQERDAGPGVELAALALPLQPGFASHFECLGAAQQKLFHLLTHGHFNFP